MVNLMDVDAAGLLVKPEVARKHMKQEPKANCSNCTRRPRETDGDWCIECYQQYPGTDGELLLQASREARDAGFTEGGRPAVLDQRQAWVAQKPNGMERAFYLGPAPSPRVTRFHGTVVLSEERAGYDASQIASEVISHLVGLDGAEVTVMLEIAAHVPEGVPDRTVRTVTENSRTLKFRSYGFERE